MKYKGPRPGLNLHTRCSFPTTIIITSQERKISANESNQMYIFISDHIIYYYYSLIRTFHISVSRWFFTGVWVTSSLLKSPGLFLVFWPFSTMLSFGWSPLVRQLPSPPVPLVIPLVTVPNAPITLGHLHVPQFFISLARSWYLYLFSHSFSFILWSDGTAKSTILQVLSFLLIIIKSGLLTGIKWSVCMLKSHWSLYVVFSRTGAGLCIYHLLVWSNLSYLHISHWITLLTQSCLALYSLCANLLHSLIIWLMVSLLSLLLLLLLYFCTYFKLPLWIVNSKYR